MISRPAEPSELKPLDGKPESLTSRVYDAIREAIIDRQLPPGCRVSEARLAAQLNVSKTPVREAMLRLAHIGLIESDGGKGGRVARPAFAKIRAAYEVREGIEAQAARLAALRGTLEDLENIAARSAACLEAAEAGEYEEFRRIDRQFHFAVAEGAQNSSLQHLLFDAYDLTWTLRRRDVPAAGDSLVCANQHVAIANAIAEQDLAGADLTMRKHIAHVAEGVLESFLQTRTSRTPTPA